MRWVIKMRTARFLLALCTAICFFFTANASISVNLSSGLLFSDDGRLLCDEERFSRIEALGDSGLYACTVAESGLILIADGDGTELTEEAYQDVRAVNGHILLCRENRWALADERLNLQSRFEFTKILPAAEDRFIAFRTELYDDMPDAIYLLLSDGRVLPAGVSVQYPDMLFYSEELSCAVSATNGCFGYLDQNGNWEILPEFSAAGNFSGGLAVAGTEDGMGMIDRMGEWIILPEYEDIRMNERYILCSNKQVRTVYLRGREGLERLMTVEGPYLGIVDDYIAVYSDDAVCLYENAELKAEFPQETLVLSGDGEYVLVSDKNGMHITNSVSGTDSDSFVSIQRLSDTEYYRCMVSVEGGAFYGLLERDGILIVLPEWKKLYIPKSGYIAAENETETVLLQLTEKHTSVLWTSLQRTDDEECEDEG